MDNARKKMKPQDRVGKAPDMTILMPMRALIRWKYCSSDIKLMHLHRQEILLRALSEQRFEDEAIAPPSWPEQLAGRELRVNTKDYALYAANPKMADELHEWLMKELTQFRLEYDTKIQGPGLVLAIEPGEEPIDALEEWRKRNVRRERWINWSSPIRRQFFMSPLGRPYCLSRTNYFKESFSFPYDEALESAIVDRTTQRPGWICLLTADAHLLGAFDSTIKQRRRVAKPVRGNASLGALMMFAGIRLLILPRYRTIDIELMHLQRKEALFHALLDASQMDVPRRTLARKELRATIDQEWKYRWVRRPID